MDNPKRLNQDKHNRSKTKKKANAAFKDHERDKRKGGDSKRPTNSVPPPKKRANSVPVAEIFEQPKVNVALRESKADELADEAVDKKKTYSRRSLVSNWTRYSELPKYLDSDDDDCLTFEESINYTSVYSVGNQFMLKETRDWLKQSESYQSPFSLDVKKLEAGIACVPFFKRHDLPEKLFCPMELQAYNEEARSNQVLYNELRSPKNSKDSHKVTLNNYATVDVNLAMIDDSAAVLKTQTTPKKSCFQIENDGTTSSYSLDGSLCGVQSRGQRPKKFAELAKPCEHDRQRVTDNVLQSVSTAECSRRETSQDDEDNLSGIKALNICEQSPTEHSTKLRHLNSSGNKENVKKEEKPITDKVASDSNSQMKGLERRESEHLKELTTVPNTRQSTSNNVYGSQDDDDELDFLLGLKETPDESARNQLQGSSGKPEETAKPATKVGSANKTDENLDDWLNSVLED